MSDKKLTPKEIEALKKAREKVLNDNKVVLK